jgi:hypothetical protein
MELAGLVALMRAVDEQDDFAGTGFQLSSDVSFREHGESHSCGSRC